VGTNVYWLSTLNNDQDIANTFASIKAANITVVRTWAFNGLPLSSSSLVFVD
jgi:mannan endo-1,4-beta-mannosidase